MFITFKEQQVTHVTRIYHIMNRKKNKKNTCQKDLPLHPSEGNLKPDNHLLLCSLFMGQKYCIPLYALLTGSIISVQLSISTVSMYQSPKKTC